MLTEKNIYRTITALFSIFMIVSAIGELTGAESVIFSMEILGYPIYLLTILGVWKIVGVVALWLPVPSLVKEWAYAGFFFNITGALLSLVFSQAPFIEDWIFAPIAFVLWLTSFVLYRRTLSTNIAIAQ